MPKSVNLTRRVHPKAIEILLKKESNRRLRDRLQAVQWAFAGVSVNEISKRIGRCRQTVGSFIERFNKKGLQGILSVGRGPGRRSSLSKRQWKIIVDWIRRGPRSLGYSFSNWDCKRLAAAIKAKWKVSLSDEQVRRKIHSEGCRLLRPKHKLPGSDESLRAKKNEFSRCFWLAPDTGEI